MYELLKDKYKITKKKVKDEIIFSVNSETESFIICRMNDYSSKYYFDIAGLSKLTGLSRAKVQIGIRGYLDKYEGNVRLTKAILEKKLCNISLLRSNIEHRSNFSDVFLNEGKYKRKGRYKRRKFFSDPLLAEIWNLTKTYGKVINNFDIKGYSYYSLEYSLKKLIRLGYIIYVYPNSIELTKQGIFRLWQDNVASFRYLKELDVI
jgi:hypothetical protein